MSQSPLNLTARLFLASVGCGLSSVWMTVSFLELWKKLVIFSFWLHFAQVFYLCFFSLNHHCLVLLFPPLKGALSLMITWMLPHENVRGKEQSQSSAGWTAQYPLSTFTHFSFLSVLFWSASNTLRLQAISDVSMSFPFLLLQSQLDPAGTSHNRPQLSMAGVSVYFLLQRLLLPDGSCYLFI